MRNKEEYILDSLNEIIDFIRSPTFKKHIRETHENNVMLKSIIKYIHYKELDANGENERDFGRNVLANIVSNICGFNK